MTDEITLGAGYLARVPDRDPPEWEGELPIWGYVYRLRGHVEWRGDRNIMVLRAVEAPKPVPGGLEIQGVDE